MCGIIGYLGKNKAAPILIDGLKRLEYRGYDSAGIALIKENEPFQVVKQTGRVLGLSKKIDFNKMDATCGISHTRWATHGGVTNENAHPHVSSDGKICIVHNGVIENHNQLRRFLEGKGYSFKSGTDTEALANLIAYNYSLETGNAPERLQSAVRKSVVEIEGTYGIAVIASDLPGHMIGARKGSPLILGIGQDEMMIGSDITAFSGRVSNVVYLNDGEVVYIHDNSFQIVTNHAVGVDPVLSELDWKEEETALGEFEHYMLKEIFEQPKALKNAMRGRFSEDLSTAQFGGLNMTPRELRQVDRILFLACGTAWHACLIAEYCIEKYARIPVEVEYASEFRYRNAPLDKNTLVIVISQSGETLDTLEAQREAIRKGYRVLGITNVVGSTIARENDGGIFQHSGPEIGVASTKAFTSQVLITTMLSIYLGRLRDLSYSDGKDIVRALQCLPEKVSQVLEQADHIKRIALKYAEKHDFLFLGRQAMFPIALEGALKLKEITYIHAEGYPAAEMKHGPIALICPDCPTVAIAMKDELYHKSLSNIQEIKARKGAVIAITDAGDDFPEELADDIIQLPKGHEILHPILATIPMQLFSYYTAVARGCDVDKPRNLAKSVTVE